MDAATPEKNFLNRGNIGKTVAELGVEQWDSGVPAWG